MNRLFLISFLFLVLSGYSFGQEKNLQYFLDEGMMNSPMIKDLNNQSRMNSVDSLLVTASRKPSVKLNGLMMFAPIIHDYGYSEAITNNANLFSTVSVSQNIFNNKTVEAQYAKIGIENQGIRNTLQISTKDLKKSITDQYLITYGIFSDINLKKSLIKSSMDQQSLLKQLVENGVFRQSDYLTLLLEIQLEESDLNDLQIQYRKELSTLKLICGIRDTSNSNLEQPHIVLNTASTKDSPFLRKFRIDSLQIMNEKAIIDRSYKPVVSWMSDAGLINNDPSLIYKNFGVSLGMTLTMPIYDGNQRVLNYRKLQYSEETRKNYEGYFKQQFDQQVIQLNEELSRTIAAIPKMKQQLSLGEKIVSEERLLLNSGGVSVTDLINAVKNLLSLKRSLNQYELKVMGIVNEINYWRE